MDLLLLFREHVQRRALGLRMDQRFSWLVRLRRRVAHGLDQLGGGVGRLEINKHLRQLEILFARPGRKQPIELFGVALHGRFIRALQPDEDQRIRSQQIEFVRVGDRLVVDPIECREKAGAQLGVRRRGVLRPVNVIASAHARQSGNGGDGFSGVGFSQGLLPPRGGILPLQGDAGRVTKRPIRIAQVGPDCGHGRRVPVTVKTLELVAQVALRLEPKIRLGGRGGFIACVTDAPDRRLGRAPAQDHIQRAIDRIDRDVRRVEGLGGQEQFHVRRVGRAARGQMRGVDAPILVVEEEECVLIFFRELRAVAKGVSGGRTSPDVDQAPVAVEVMVRPFARAVAEAKVRATDDVGQARGPIPRVAHVPFHVRVPSEQLADVIDLEVILIPHAAREQLPLLSLGIGDRDPALRRVGVVHETRVQARQQRVFAPVLWHARGINGCERRRISAIDEKRLAIRRQFDRVNSVIAGKGNSAEQCDNVIGVELVVLVHVLHPEETLAFRHHIQTVEGPEQSVRASDRQIHQFNLRLALPSRRRHGQAVNPAVP